MEICRIHLPVAGALSPIFTVVTPTCYHAAQWLQLGTEPSLAAMVFETNQRPRTAGEVALDRDVIHEAAGSADRVEVEGLDAGQPGADEGLIVVTEQLIAGADRQHHDIGLNRLAQALRLIPNILRGDVHLFILATVEEDQVEGTEVGNCFHPDLGHLGPDVAPRTALLDGDQISAVAGHAQQRRVQVANAQCPGLGHFYSSQNGATQPRCTMARRSSCVGV